MMQRIVDLRSVAGWNGIVALDRWAIRQFEDEFEALYRHVRRRIADIQPRPCACGCGDCDDAPDDLIADALETAGLPIPHAERRRFERAFGRDLSAVRLHMGAAADRATSDLGAQAFVLGDGIVLGSEAVAAMAADDGALLAHEIVHVLQQRTGLGYDRRLFSRDRLEAQAIAAQRAFAAGLTPALTLLPAPRRVQAVNPIIAKCGSVCAEVIMDTRKPDPVPCGLVDCGFTQSTAYKWYLITSWCVFSCAMNRYAAFILNTRFGKVGPIFVNGNN